MYFRFDGSAQQDAIPKILSGWNRYHLTTFGLKDADPDYEGLYRLLTGKPKLKPEPLGPPISLLEKADPGAPGQVLPPLLEIPERKTDFMRIIKVLQFPDRNPFFTGRERASPLVVALIAQTHKLHRVKVILTGSA